MTSNHAAVNDLEIEPVFFLVVVVLCVSSRGHPWHAACTAVYVTDSKASS